MTITPSLLTPVSAPPNSTPPAPLSSSGASGSGGLSFSDVVNTLNPLQHIPVVSGLYRAATGNSISPASQVAGDTLYGAFTGGMSLLGAGVGLASSSADVVMQQVTGSDIGQHVLSALGMGSAPSASSAGTASTTLNPYAAALHTPLGDSLGNAQHSGGSSQYSDAQAQYQRTQAFDVMNKKLVKMVA